MTTRIRSFTELSQIETFEDRYAYLMLKGEVGAVTFGYDRYMNQQFYRSTEWKHVRNEVITRDLGMDLGVLGHEIFDKIIIHHMNPMTPDDLVGGENSIADPEFLICTTLRTHNAIHWGDARQLVVSQPTERRPGDQVPWR